MKVKANVSSSRRKARKRHFNAPSHERRIRMTVRLARELQDKHGVKRIPIRKGDTVKVLRGSFRDSVGKVVAVMRKEYTLHIEGVERTKKNGEKVFVPVHHSKLILEELEMTGSRQRILDRLAPEEESVGQVD